MRPVRAREGRPAQLATCFPKILAILGSMGYNPQRKFKARPTDYVVLAIGMLTAAALVVWGFLS